MAENVYRKNPNRFKQAFVALAANQTEGTIITGWDGEFNLLISSYSNEVNYQIREPAVLDEDGNEVTPATSWQTYETFTVSRKSAHNC